MKRKLLMNVTKGVSAAFLLALVTSPGVHAGGAMKGTMGFDQLDRDGDGRISRQEATQHEMLNNRFRTADRDRDGRVDEAEFSAFETMESSDYNEPWKVNP